MSQRTPSLGNDGQSERADSHRNLSTQAGSYTVSVTGVSVIVHKCMLWPTVVAISSIDFEPGEAQTMTLATTNLLARVAALSRQTVRRTNEYLNS